MDFEQLVNDLVKVVSSDGRVSQEFIQDITNKVKMRTGKEPNFGQRDIFLIGMFYGVKSLVNYNTGTMAALISDAIAKHGTSRDNRDKDIIDAMEKLEEN